MMHLHLHLFLLCNSASFLLGVMVYRCLHRIVFHRLDAMKKRVDKIEATSRCMRENVELEAKKTEVRTDA